jgi:hypothetical protein
VQRREGLFRKYMVYRNVDDDDLLELPLEGCFVLRPATDPVAAHALSTYALQTPDLELRNDLFQWLWEIRNVTES